MYNHNITPRGPIYLERLTQLPPFNRDRDPGRLIIIKNGLAYFGSINEWKYLGIFERCVFSNNIHFGFESNSVKASDIPAYLPSLSSSVSTEKNIQLVINDCYRKFKDVESGNFFKDGSINASKLNLNPRNGGLSSRDIKTYDTTLIFDKTPCSKTIDEVLTILRKRTGNDIELGLALTKDNFSISANSSIRDALQEVFNYSADLTADKTKCKYYEYEPTGNTHCVESNVQNAITTLFNHLQNHKIIDHLDVQHNWGICGQYLGTYGEDDEECCNAPHLPLKFKTIHAKEIDVTVQNAECIGSKDIEITSTMKLQPLLTSIIKRLCQMHPVGSVYISFNPTNPSQLFYGTWEYLGSRFLLGCDNPNDTAGQIGGSATHTLTIEEMPSHTHRVKGNDANTTDQTLAPHLVADDAEFFAEDNNSIETAGGNQPHNNMPPYIKVHMWRRVA